MIRAVLIACLLVSGLATTAAAQSGRTDGVRPAPDLSGIPMTTQETGRRFDLDARDFTPGPPADDASRQALDDILGRSEAIAGRAVEEGAKALGMLPEEGQGTSQSGSTSPYRVTILISESMGEDVLRRYFAAYPDPPLNPAHPRVRFALRGIRDGETITQGAMRIASFMGLSFDLEDPNDPTGSVPDRKPLVVLEPRLFDAAERDVVPALIVERIPADEAMAPNFQWGGLDPQAAIERAVQGGLRPPSPPGRIEPVAIFYGDNISPTGAVDYVVRGARGDEGIFGSVWVPSEEDFREYARRKMAERLGDINADPSRVQQGYFDRQREELEKQAIVPASVSVIEPISFARRLQRDIHDYHGAVIARAGDIFDPSTVMPFDRRIFIFDGMSEAEVAYVEEAARTRPPGVSKDLFIVTMIPRFGTREWLQALVDRLDAPVHFMKPEIVRSFGIRHTVSVVEPMDGIVVRREVAVSSLPVSASPTREVLR